MAAEEVVFGGVVLGRRAMVAGRSWRGAPRWGLGNSGSGEVGVEGEELLEVHHSGGESELEQCFAFAAVAGFAESVRLEFGEFAFNERSSSELAARCRSGLFGSCVLQSLLVEVEGDNAAVATGGAACLQRTGRASVTETQLPDGSVLV